MLSVEFQSLGKLVGFIPGEKTHDSTLNTFYLRRMAFSEVNYECAVYLDWLHFYFVIPKQYGWPTQTFSITVTFDARYRAGALQSRHVLKGYHGVSEYFEQTL